jgi:hypothetical protein
VQSAFRKISRVGSLTGGTKWYLSADCLLAAKRVMYAVEYRRFYLRDLESIVVWPNRLWLLRPIVPGVLLGALGVWLVWLRHWEMGALLWRWTDFTTGAIFAGAGLAWALLELALGPTAKTQIRTTGATVDLPLVMRTHRARRVLAKIEVAVRAARGGVLEQATAPAAGPQPAGPSVKTSPEAASAPASIGDLT